MDELAQQLLTLSSETEVLTWYKDINDMFVMQDGSIKMPANMEHRLSICMIDVEIMTCNFKTNTGRSMGILIHTSPNDSRIINVYYVSSAVLGAIVRFRNNRIYYHRIVPIGRNAILYKASVPYEPNHSQISIESSTQTTDSSPPAKTRRISQTTTPSSASQKKT